MGGVVAIRLENTNGKLPFAVNGNGHGIDEAHLGRVFERYHQVPGERPDKKDSGIGLAICKEFIEATGGTLWVKFG